MVSFATLILTLVSGTYPVELIVDRAVAAVEMRLDGEVVGRLTAEPWRLNVDFGETLRPHELEAIALDARGRELARVRQMVNLPRSPAEVALFLERGDDGRFRSARAVWEAASDVEVQEVRALLDGSPVQVTGRGRITLPPHSGDQLHYLVVQVRFDGDLRAEAAIAFGGRFGASSHTEITSVAVTLRKGVDELPSGSLDGWFRLRGKPVRVVAVERPPAGVLLVRDRSAEALLGALASRLRRHSLADRVGVRDGLRRGDSVYLMDAVPRSSDRNDRDLTTWLFPVSPDLAGFGRGRGIAWTLTNLKLGDRNRGRARIAQAVAAAGLRAAGSGRPRAVVLLLGPAAAEHGRHRPRDVLAYLETLQVPFSVWAVGRGVDSALAEHWGGAIDVSDPDGLHAAVDGLRALLDRQRIVWLEGQLLPQRIELSDSARKHVERAGARTAGAERRDANADQRPVRNPVRDLLVGVLRHRPDSMYHGSCGPGRP